MRAARRFVAAGPQKHGGPETRVARIACGTPIFDRRTGKTRQIRNPGPPDCVRHAESWPPDRKNAADLEPGSPGLRAARRFFGTGPQKHGRSEARIARVACGTPVLPRGAGPRGAGPAPAEGRRRFPPRKPGSGVYFGGAFSWFVLPWLPGAPPRRLRTTIVPGFYAPGRQNRRAARKLGDLALGCAVILRSGGAKTACRPRNGRPGPPADR